jgi:hypothetical protein
MPVSTTSKNTPAASSPPTLYLAVRAAFVARGDSLNAWCDKNQVRRQWAEQALKGQSTGPAARQLVKRIARAAGIDAA